MKHIFKIASLFFLLIAIWIGLLRSSLIPHLHSLLFPIYLVGALGVYGIFMVFIGVLRFPTCPAEAQLLDKDVAEAKAFLNEKGVDITYHEN